MAVYVFVHDDYADWELGYVLPELASPPVAPGIPKKPREVVTFALDGNPVRSMGSLQVTPASCIDRVKADSVDALILPGGTFWRAFDDERLAALVSRLIDQRRWVAAICAATGYLARLGLLDSVQHTSNSLSFLHERAPGYRGEARYRSALAVADGGLITASGLGAVDFTVEILRALAVYPAEICDLWYRAFKYGEDPSTGQSA